MSNKKKNKQSQQQKMNRLEEKRLLEESKKERNLADLQAMMNKWMVSLDELAYKIEMTKNKKVKAELEKKFDKKLNLIMSLQQGNFSILMH